MKNSKVLISVLVCLTVVFTSCGKVGTESSSVKVSPTIEDTPTISPMPTITPTPTKEPAPEVTAEPVPVPVVVEKECPWEIFYEDQYSFSAFDTVFYDEKTALTVGASGEIHYSKDGGKTYSQADNSSMCRYGLDVVNENICYTCGNAGQITKSMDGGKTFTRVSDFKTMSEIIDFIDENTGIVVTSRSEMGLTKDGATAWSEIALPAKVISACMESEGNINFIGTDFNLYMTTDGGTNWSDCPLNLPEGKDYKTKVKSMLLITNEDGSYTIYCIQDSTKALKCYTTSDRFMSFTETPMPKLPLVPEYLHMNKAKDLLTTYNANNQTIRVLKHK